MSKIIEVKVHRAASIGDEHAPILILTAGDEMPDLGGAGYIEEYNARFLADAQAIETGLWKALPGGTYDRLLGLMLQRKASHFIVSYAGLKEET